MFGPKRGNFLIIFNKFISNYGGFIIALALSLFFIKEFSTSSIAFLGILLLSIIFQILKFLSTTYEITKDIFLVRKGIISKKKIEIPLETITTVDITQSLFFQLLRVSTVRVETTVQTLDSTDDLNVILALKKEEALHFKNTILNNKDSLDINTEETPKVEMNSSHVVDSIKLPAGRIFILGLLQSKLGYMILPITAVVSLMGILPAIFREYIEEAVSNDVIEPLLTIFSESDISYLIENFTIYLVILISILIIAMYLTGTVLSIIFTLIKYAGYTIKRDSRAMYINYGLFNKKAFSLTNEKISGILIKQSLLMRIFGYYSVMVYAIGYGNNATNNSSTIAFFLPIGRKDDIVNLLNSFLPEISIETDFDRNRKKTLKYFLLNSPILFLLVLTISTNILFVQLELSKYIYAALPFMYLLVLLQLIKYILRYKNEKISIKPTTISHVRSGFGKEITHLKIDLIETATFKTTATKIRHNIGHLVIQFFGPIGSSRLTAKNFRQSDFVKLSSTLKH